MLVPAVGVGVLLDGRLGLESLVGLDIGLGGGVADRRARWLVLSVLEAVDDCAARKVKKVVGKWLD